MDDRKRGNLDKPAETTRRAFVAGALGGAAALIGGCGSGSTSNGAATGGVGGAAGSAGATTGGAGGSAGSGAAPGGGGSGGSSAVCTVYPAETEGPYYLNLDLLRSDIREDKQGTELDLEIVVQRASDCTPIKDAAVDVWHCDADGVYSGYPGQLGGLDTTGQKFLRGTQVTGADGRVSFVTIYPGWYPGRTTHIHFKVHVSTTSVATSQMYFPEDVTSAVYTVAPYAARGQKDTSNLADGVVAGNLPPLLVLSKTATGYTATLTVTVAG